MENQKIEIALERLVKAVKAKIAAIEADNSALRSEVAKLRRELKLKDEELKLNSVANDVALEKPKVVKKQQTFDEVTEEEVMKKSVQMSLAELKKMAS